MKRVLKLIGLVLLVLAIVVIARTFLVPSKQVAALQPSAVRIDPQKAARDLSGAIPFQTISWEEGGTSEQKTATQEAFVGFHTYLEKTFPQVYRSSPTKQWAQTIFFSPGKEAIPR